ncbi:MAG: hypothetical protein ACRD4H_08220 [Candidatus Acidiferrales bacterium]
MLEQVAACGDLAEAACGHRQHHEQDQDAAFIDMDGGCETRKPLQAMCVRVVPVSGCFVRAAKAALCAGATPIARDDRSLP